MKTNELRPLIYGYEMNGYGREFNLETMIRCILGEITVEDYSSDCDPNLVGENYIPVRFKVKFIKMAMNESTGKAVGEEVVIQSFADFLGLPDGGFFPNINQIKGLNLTRSDIQYHQQE